MLAIVFPLSGSLDAVYFEIYGAERLPRKVIITYQPFSQPLFSQKRFRVVENLDIRIRSELNGFAGRRGAGHKA
jgi:hypothetical protein